MADVQRTGGIGGNEFDLYFPPAAGNAAAVACTQREDMRHGSLVRFRFKKKIDESGASDFRFGDIRRCR